MPRVASNAVAGVEDAAGGAPAALPVLMPGVCCCCASIGLPNVITGDEPPEQLPNGAFGGAASGEMAIGWPPTPTPMRSAKPVSK